MFVAISAAVLREETIESFMNEYHKYNICVLVQVAYLSFPMSYL